MKFIRAEDDFNTMLFHRHVSTDGTVEVGVYAVLFGFRVRAGMVGHSWCELDYCGGADQETVERIYSAVLATLETQERPNWDVFPTQVRKPMGNDPECMQELETLAGKHKRIKIRPLGSIREISNLLLTRLL